MKKIWLLTTLLVAWLLLTGCNTNLVQNEPSENDNQLSVVEDSNQTMNNNLSLREKLLNQFEWVDIASLNKDEQYIFNMIKYPLCEHQEIYPASPRKISEVVENCTKKKKTWDFADGYGWVFPYGYTYDKNIDEILLLEFVDDYYYKVNNYWFDNNIEKACIDITDWNFMYGKIMTWNDKLSFDNYLNENRRPWAEYALNKAFKNWFIIQFPYSIQPSLCTQWDKDCEFMYSVWARSDDKWNYFVAWKVPLYWWPYYIVNDYILDPWHSDDYSYYETNKNLTWRSKWYFWWVENDKIIVKRFVDYRSTWKDIPYTNEFWDELYRIGSEFTLETCEIPFSKIEHDKMRVVNS